MCFCRVAQVGAKADYWAVVRKTETKQWSFQVDDDLDAATKEAARVAGMPLSVFVRAVVRGYLGHEHGLVPPVSKAKRRPKKK